MQMGVRQRHCLHRNLPHTGGRDRPAVTLVTTAPNTPVVCRSQDATFNTALTTDSHVPSGSSTDTGHIRAPLLMVMVIPLLGP